MGRDCGPVVTPIARICTWSRRRDSNPEPAVYKTAALPIELRRRGAGPYRRWTLRRRGMIRSVARTGQATRAAVAGGPPRVAGPDSVGVRTARQEIVGGRFRAVWRRLGIPGALPRLTSRLRSTSR